mmetsp:Transcript_14558/g.37735  ORF Transcript_14558/g.37735 Transcript_14558/m.37735 type:complete len:291 (-) Transcript_14558:655-1527(-)
MAVMAFLMLSRTAPALMNLGSRRWWVTRNTLLWAMWKTKIPLFSVPEGTTPSLSSCGTTVPDGYWSQMIAGGRISAICSAEFGLTPTTKQSEALLGCMNKTRSSCWQDWRNSSRTLPTTSGGPPLICAVTLCPGRSSSAVVKKCDSMPCTDDSTPSAFDLLSRSSAFHAGWKKHVWNTRLMRTAEASSASLNPMEKLISGAALDPASCQRPCGFSSIVQNPGLSPLSALNLNTCSLKCASGCDCSGTTCPSVRRKFIFCCRMATWCMGSTISSAGMKFKRLNDSAVSCRL